MATSTVIYWLLYVEILAVVTANVSQSSLLYCNSAEQLFIQLQICTIASHKVRAFLSEELYALHCLMTHHSGRKTLLSLTMQTSLWWSSLPALALQGPYSSQTLTAVWTGSRDQGDTVGSTPGH